MTDRRSGLTLAELLVALFVSALIMTMLAVALGGFSRQSRVLAQHRLDVESRDDLIRVLQLALRNTLPLTVHDPKTDKDQALFIGTPDRLHLLVRQTRWPTPPGLYEFEFQVHETTPDNWQVELRRHKLARLADFGQTAFPGQPAIVFKGKAKPKFSYAGIGKPQDKWQLAPRPPSAVMLVLGGKLQAAMSVPPAINLPGPDRKTEPAKSGNKNDE